MRGLTATKITPKSITSLPVNVKEFVGRHKGLYNFVLIKCYFRIVSLFEAKYFQFSVRAYVDN